MLRRAIQFIAWLFVLLAMRVATAAPLGGSCELYVTGFQALSGPPTLEQGPFVVDWCLNGATVSSTGFCPTGSALKLDASGDDPILLVHVGDAGCASVSVSFTYAQFVATGTVLKAGTTNATTAPCSPSTPTTIGTLSTTGGACTLVSFTVDLAGAQGVAFKFDHGANSNAILIDDLIVTIDACCSQLHGCCEAGGPGCSDAAVEACVCAADPFCCQTQWDTQCVAEVDLLACGDCDGSGPADCLMAFATDFGTLYSTTSICTLFPQLFEACEGSPPTLTISGACAGSGDPALRFGTGFPYSAAITRCIDLSQVAAPVLRFRFTRNAGSLGPRVDYRVDGGEWLVGWQPASGQGTSGCTDVEVNLALLASATNVQFRFLSGSSVANGAVIDDIAIATGQLPHDCCVAGMAGCTDAAIETCTCAIDDYCCATAWDAACVALATSACDAGCSGVAACGASDAGPCESAHATPFCADADCCNAVCTYDDFCCQSEWDALCVQEAATVCAGAGCGPSLGSCFATSPAAGCNDATCCESVCVLDPICCLAAWDAICAAEAVQLCDAQPTADLDGDGLVNGADLAVLLAGWGSSGIADLDGSGVTDAADLAILLAAWSV